MEVVCVDVFEQFVLALLESSLVDGYFRIKRGTDECGIESMAVTADVVPWTDASN